MSVDTVYMLHIITSSYSIIAKSNLQSCTSIAWYQTLQLNQKVLEEALHIPPFLLTKFCKVRKRMEMGMQGGGK